MGCGPSSSKSKLQDDESPSPSPAVALCRERCSLLELALSQRFTFAQAHAAYLLSLDSFALSLHRFSILNLPPPTSDSHSNSDSPSDSSLHLHHTYVPPDYHDGGYFFNTTTSHMKNHTTPSLLHTQAQIQSTYMSSMSMYGAQAQLLSASPPSSDNNPINPPPHFTTTTSNNQNDNPPSYSCSDHNFINGNDNNANYGSTGPAAGGVLGANSSLPAPPSSSSNAPSPPPPPPPGNLTWDFLNPFDTTFGSFSPAGHDFREREVREAEGIPDLEDDVAVLKEIHVDQKFVGGGSRISGIHSKPSVADHAALAQERTKDGGNASAHTSFKGGEPQVVREIQLQFECASNSGSKLAKFLEVGKLPYNGKSRTTQAGN